MELKVFPSERFVVTVQIGTTRNKIFSVGFDRFDTEDPSIFVQWPYYSNPYGILSVATFPSGGRQNLSISLVPEGKTTSHLVKFSHHQSGEVHFSQSKKILTSIRKKSVPLMDFDGHLFTVQIQGPDYFSKVVQDRDRDHYDINRTVINFSFETENPEAIKFVCFWKHINNIRSTDPYLKTGPSWATIEQDGKILRGFVLAPPNFKKIDHLLLLACKSIPKLDRRNDSCFTFIGGFDPREITSDTTKETRFLAALYPSEDYQELRDKIGSVDYTPIDPVRC